MTKAPTPTEKSKKQRDNIKNVTKNFDYTTIADLLRTAIRGFLEYILLVNILDKEIKKNNLWIQFYNIILLKAQDIIVR